MVALFYLKFSCSFTASYKVFQNIFNKILASYYINTLHLYHQNGIKHTHYDNNYTTIRTRSNIKTSRCFYLCNTC